MKYVNLMKLLSALLCTVMLFSACDKSPEEPIDTSDTTTAEAEETTTTQPQSTVLDPVDPVLENFFAVSKESGPVKLGAAERFNGKYYDGASDGTVTVFKESSIDFLNVQTDTYTVYNAKLEKTVLTLAHSYERGVYDSFDWNDIYVNEDDLIGQGEEKVIPKYPTGLLEVHPVRVWGNVDTYLIEVRRATLTPIDEEIIEENEGDFYTVEVVYEYYDAAGTKLCESFESQSYNGGVNGYSMNETADVLVVLDATIVYLDAKTGLATSVINGSNDPMRLGYFAGNEQYGYYVGYNAAPLGTETNYVEVYSKNDNTLMLRYYLEACDDYSYAVLADGSFFVQYINRVEDNSGLPYDVEVDGTRYSVDTYIIKVPTGEMVPVACDYVVDAMYNRETLLKMIETEKWGIEISENAPNIAVATKIVDKKVDLFAEQIVVFNNDGSVMYAMDKIIPEQKVGFVSMYTNPFGYTVLPNGDYLVELTAPTEYQYAIATKDGVVRSYLNTQMEYAIAGEYIVYPHGVYDYDMKLVLAFEGEEEEDTLRFELAIGDRILVSKLVEDEETSELERLFFELKKGENGEPVLSEPLFDGEVVERVVSRKDYFILKNAETGKYTLYNAELGHVLTTANDMNVLKCDGKYLVATSLATPNGNVSLYYTIGQ